MIWNNYKSELRHEASSAMEAAELAALAGQISRLKVPPLSTEAKARIAGELGFTPRGSAQSWILGFGAMATIGLIAVITLAQYAHPGSALYSVKHQSDRLQRFLHSETSQTPVTNSENKNSNDSLTSPQSGDDESPSATSTPISGTKSSDDKVEATPFPLTTTSGASGSSSDDGGSSSPGGGTSGGGSTPDGSGTSGGHGGTSDDGMLSGSGR